MNSFLTNWKSSVNGILAFLITTGTVLLATGNALFSQRITLYLTIGLALCRAYVGLLEKDADAVQPAAPAAVSGSSSTTAKVLIILMFSVSVLFMGAWSCNTTTSLHKAAAAADAIASSLQTAESINEAATTQGVETATERDTVGTYIANAARANDALIASITAAEQTGSTSVPQTVISAFQELVVQADALNSEGILKLKSASAQQQFQVIVSAIQTELAVLKALAANGPAAPSPLPPPTAMLRGPAAPSPLPPPAAMPAPVCEPGTPCKLHGRVAAA